MTISSPRNLFAKQNKRSPNPSHKHIKSYYAGSDGKENLEGEGLTGEKYIVEKMEALKPNFHMQKV